MAKPIQLPPELLALLDRRGKERGLGLADQVIEMVRAFLQGEVDPILQPNDPLLAAPVAEGSGLGDLAADHDRYLSYSSSYFFAAFWSWVFRSLSSAGYVFARS